MKHENVIDVSLLEPPEPMKKITQALVEYAQQLDAGQELIILHRREPLPLYPKLLEMGFSYQVEAVFPPGYRIRIKKA